MTDLEYGSAEHAAKITAGRHPGVQTALAWLAFTHLPVTLQRLSRPIYAAACDLLARIASDSAELVTALNRLVEAKDWMVRAGIRSDEGKPGPVPRPATVVDPPTATDWPQTSRDLVSGGLERIDRHLNVTDGTGRRHGDSAAGTGRGDGPKVGGLNG